jgi:hypothetical protein
MGRRKTVVVIVSPLTLLLRVFVCFCPVSPSIFNSGRLAKVSLPDSELLKLLSVYFLLDVLIVILWAGISPPAPTLESHSTMDYTFVQVCTSVHDAPFRIAVYLLRALALLAGAAFAIRLRDVTDAFNESKVRGVGESEATVRAAATCL